MIDKATLPFLIQFARKEVRKTERVADKIEALRLALEKLHPLKPQKKETDNGR